MLIKCARGEKRGIGAAAMLFEIVEAHSTVLADGVIGLLGESQVGIHNAVSFGVSEFHNSSSVIQYFLHSHSTIFVLKRRMCEMAFLRGHYGSITKYSFRRQEVYFEYWHLFRTRQALFELEVELPRDFLLCEEVRKQVHLLCRFFHTSNIKNKA